VLVELEYLVVGGETCDRCGDTREGVRAAVDDARSVLSTASVTLELIERELDPARLADSNRVLVNGRPAEEWLGGHAVVSDCPSCSELIDDSACCREIEVGGVRTEAVGRDVVFDAIMAAAGLAPVGVPGEACCVPDAHAALTVTVVTGPGCG
jgi:hypothetical protein